MSGNSCSRILAEELPRVVGNWHCCLRIIGRFKLPCWYFVQLTLVISIGKIFELVYAQRDNRGWASGGVIDDLNHPKCE